MEQRPTIGNVEPWSVVRNRTERSGATRGGVAPGGLCPTGGEGACPPRSSKPRALPGVDSPRVASWSRLFLVWALCSGVYVATLGSRAVGQSDNAHYVHLADSFLRGQLSLVSEKPPGDNDWSLYQGRWYVSFPPFPALVIAPAVALFGLQVWDRLFWALLAGLAPALLLALLSRLREAGHSTRTPREDLLLTALFAFGSPYYYTAVQGTVWFSAHVVASALIVVFLLGAIDARRPLLAGAALGLAFMTRPPTLLLGLLFAFEALRASRRSDAAAPTPETETLRAALRAVDLPVLARRVAWFALPLLVVGAVAMWMNAARFDDPFEFGHTHLQIRWRGRIEKWGLFNYHYLGRNLAVFLASLPWLSNDAPYLTISRHGLALWVTTPVVLLVLWPARRSLMLTGLAIAAFAVALLDLCYQNSGWVQFAYRFSLDYFPLLILLLALGGRRFGTRFHAAVLLAIAINAFGAFTFDRVPRLYDRDPTQKVLFQPD
jgi:hypothetical protein